MRDVVGVTALIERAFVEDMDTQSQKAMREMRWMGLMFGWMDWFSAPGQGLMPGYVWVEGGQIVGNATVRRLSAFGRGWMIGNVAVAPEWRRQGIARQLLEASIELARGHHADWIALQVRSDNDAAHKLYQSLGFVDTGEMVYFERTQLDRIAQPRQLTEGRLRPARANDMDRLYTLAQSQVPDSARWAEPIYRSSFDVGIERSLTDWITNTQHVWRVVEVGDQIWGAAMITARHWPKRGQLHLWIVPLHVGHIEQILVDSVLAELTSPLQAIAARVPGDHVAGRVALTTRGFRQVRALTSMRLTL